MDRHPNATRSRLAGIRVTAQHAVERGPDGQAQDGTDCRTAPAHASACRARIRASVSQSPTAGVKRPSARRPMALDEGIGRPGKQMTARGPFECRVDGVVHPPASGLPKPAGQIHAAWLVRSGISRINISSGKRPRGQSGGARCQHGRWIGEHRDNQILRAGTAGRQRQQPLDFWICARDFRSDKMGIREGGTTEFDHAPVALIGSGRRRPRGCRTTGGYFSTRASWSMVGEGCTDGARRGSNRAAKVVRRE